jgi:hypothetical protein
MPYGALAFTVTTPPLAPLLCEAVGAERDAVGAGLDDEDDGEAEDEEPEPDADDEPMPLGTEVASFPSSTSTWPAATDELAVAVTPEKDPAIFAALAAAPVPYSTWVDDRAVMLPTLPALKPAEVSACDSWLASPAV